MGEFTFVKPKSLTQIFVLMEQSPGYSLLAGGTDLMVKLKEKLIQPSMIIDVGSLPELQGIQEKAGYITIGAAVSHDELVESAVIQRYAPLLSAAALTVGSPQIRNQGTIGGNIGNASPAADTVPALIAYGANAIIVSKTRTRKCLLEELFTGPGRTALQLGEIITAISFPAQQANVGSSFQKLGKRKALSISVVNAAIVLQVDDVTHRVKLARIVVGSVAPTAIRIREAEQVLLDKAISDVTIQEAGKIVAAVIKPIDDVRSTAIYRKEVAGNLVKRALETIRKQFESLEVLA